MHFRSLLAAVIILFVASSAFATNGHQLSAIGAYQQGMGGAVTAAPYDSSTAITNPAGMAEIGSRTDFSFEGFFPDRKLSFGLGGGETQGGSTFYLVPAIGWTAPVNDTGNVFFGGGMYGVSGMGVDFDSVKAPMMETTFGGPLDPGSATAHIWSQYQFWKMAPTLAVKSGQFAFGFALNVDYQALGFKNMFTGTMGGNPAKIGMDLSEIQGATGAGATIGILYHPTDTFTAGFSYATKQYFNDFKWRLGAGDISFMPDANGLPVSSKDGIYTMKLNFPQQAAIGVGVRPLKNLLWTADIKWINFHDTYNNVKLRGDFTGPFSSAQEINLNFGWNDVWVYATGVQVDVSPKLALRAGFNYSSSPITAEHVDSNIAFPAIERRRVSGGFTYRFGPNWEITAAYMKAFNEELTSASGSGTTITLQETGVDTEVSYRF